MLHALIALLLTVMAAAGAVAQTLAESLVELEQRTREYQESLERLVALQEKEAARTETAAGRYRGLLAEGLVSKRDVENAERAAAEALAKLEDTRARVIESNRVVLEVRTQARLALLPRPRIGEERVTPEVVEYA